MVIAVPAVTKYIDKSRKDSFVSSAEMYINAVQTKVSNGDINVPDGETEKIYINNIDLQKGGKSPYGVGYDPLKSYVGVTNDGDDYSYAIVLVDTKGNCIPKTSLKKLDSSLVASSCTEVVGITTKKDVAINVNTDRQTLMDAKIYGNTISGTKVGNDGTIDLVVTGKNLIDYTTPWKINIEGTTFSLNDGVLTINFNGEFCSGIYKWNDVGSNFKYIFGDKKISGSFDSKSSVNKKYKVSFFDYLNNYFDITTEWNRYSATNKTALNSHRELAFYDSDVLTVSTLYAKNIQIELGSSATSYEPYKEQRYVLELKDTSGHIINGIGTGETIEKQNGRWGVNNGSTFTELIGSTQTKLNNIKLYDGISNVFLDETIQPSNIEIKYYQ